MHFAKVEKQGQKMTGLFHDPEEGLMLVKSLKLFLNI